MFKYISLQMLAIKATRREFMSGREGEEKLKEMISWSDKRHYWLLIYEPFF